MRMVYLGILLNASVHDLNWKFQNWRQKKNLFGLREAHMAGLWKLVFITWFINKLIQEAHHHDCLSILVAVSKPVASGLISR